VSLTDKLCTKRISRFVVTFFKHKTKRDARNSVVSYIRQRNLHWSNTISCDRTECWGRHLNGRGNGENCIMRRTSIFSFVPLIAVQNYLQLSRYTILRISKQTFLPFWYLHHLHSCSRHCAISWKVAGSIPDSIIGLFHLHNPFGRTMALGSTQPLTEMSTRSISWG
jgi:hypothetical protein